MWNSTFFNVQILDVFSLEREKIYKNVYRKTSHRQVYLIRILPSEKNANTTHYTNPQMKKKISLYIKTSFGLPDILQCHPHKIIIKK